MLIGYGLNANIKVDEGRDDDKKEGDEAKDDDKKEVDEDKNDDKKEVEKVVLPG